jgi:hypothetical protein
MSTTGWIEIYIHFLKEWHLLETIIAVETA